MPTNHYTRRLKILLLITVNIAVYGSIVLLFIGVARELKKHQIPAQDQIRQAIEATR